MGTGNPGELLITKMLPVNYPLITTYTQHAHLLSILSCYEFTYPWIYSNYIQLYINKDYKHNWADFYYPFPYELRPSDTCKWVITQKVKRDIVSIKWGSVTEFIMENINNDNYIHTMLNYFHVPNSTRYQKQQLLHDILVYGYNFDEKVFYVADFFKQKYSFEKIAFSDLELAFSTYHLTKNSDYLNGLIYLYSINKDCDYMFNINNIINSIRSYLDAALPEYWYMYNFDNRCNIVFGTEIYDTLKNYIVNQVNNHSYIDVRPFHLLYDHKKIMSLRLKYLQIYGMKDPDFKHIENQAQLGVNLIVKYNLSQEKEVVCRVIKTLDEIKNEEQRILQDYVDHATSEAGALQSRKNV